MPKPIPYYRQPGRTERIAEVMAEAKAQSARQARIAKVTPEKLERFWGLLQSNPAPLRFGQRLDFFDGENDIDVAIAQLERFESNMASASGRSSEQQSEMQAKMSVTQRLFGFLH